MQALGSVQDQCLHQYLVSPIFEHFPRCPKVTVLGHGRCSASAKVPGPLRQAAPGPRIHLAYELRDISATSGHVVLSDVTMTEMRLYEAF